MKFNILITLSLIIGFTSCLDNVKKESSGKTVPKSDTLIKPTFVVDSSQAILIGQQIQLLDDKLQIRQDISQYSQSIITIKGISDSLFNTTDDFCEAFWYVHIQHKDFEGFVNGRNVFKFQYSEQDTVFQNQQGKYQIFTTDFLGMGVEYMGDLMGCPVDQPIVFKDSMKNYLGLVKLNIDEYSKQASWDNNYPFFELRADEGCHDKITSISFNNDSLVLKIHREWQEGWNEFNVLIQLDSSRYSATYLDFGERFYE